MRTIVVCHERYYCRSVAFERIVFSLYYIAMQMSDKVKQHLIKKLEDCQLKLNKLKRKRKIIKILYIVTIILSVVTSSVVVVISSAAVVTVMVVPILSAFGAILTGISARFNFNEKKSEMKRLINKFNNIKEKLNYVIQCNGDLTQAEYEEILKNF
jgi:nitrogen fixation/metabolism regulation signal transduction histidine kinase